MFYRVLIQGIPPIITSIIYQIEYSDEKPAYIKWEELPSYLQILLIWCIQPSKIRLAVIGKNTSVWSLSTLPKYFLNKLRDQMVFSQF